MAPSADNKMVPQVKKYVFFDRDGTLIEHVHHLTDVSRVKLASGAIETLSQLVSMGFRLGIVTNQSVVGLGLATREQVDEINELICSIFRNHNIAFDLVKVCYHSPLDNCLCRKPKVGLLKDEILHGGIDIYNSFMIGDQETDIIFGMNLGLQTIKIINSVNETTVSNYSVSVLNQVPEIIEAFIQKGVL
jgi:histidinol-phosphate phosphatase family protein